MNSARTPLRLLVVLPSWVGDSVMATPTLRAIRERFPGILIGVLARPGIDGLLAGTGVFDEVHVARPSGVMGPKHAAAKVRPRRYDTALLLTNSFSTALITRLAGIPRRIGYDRDARGMLLTDRLQPPRRADGRKAVVSAVDYYWTLARRCLLEPESTRSGAVDRLARGWYLELAVTDADRRAGAELLGRAGVAAADRYIVLNPGGNTEAKRWPPERFAAVGKRLNEKHGVRVLVNGSPTEAVLCQSIARECGGVSLASLGVTLSSLKAVLADARCRLMVTNDTGPRHIAAAFGVPLVSLFGPTDPRWTTIPIRPDSGETVVVADPSLPEGEIADDHPARCGIVQIGVERVIGAAEAEMRRRA